MLIPIDVHSGRCRSFFAVIEEMKLAIGHADEHESAAADIARLGMNDGEGESGSDRGIDGVPTLTHNFDSDIGCQRVDADHHRLGSVRGMHAAQRSGRLRQAKRHQQGTITSEARLQINHHESKSGGTTDIDKTRNFRRLQLLASKL